MRRGVFIAVLAGARLAAAAPSPLWDDVVHPNRMRCAAVAGDSRRLIDTERPDSIMEARGRLEAALAICSQRADLHAQLGRALVALHEYDAARPYLERARQLAPDDDDPLLAFHLGFVRAVHDDLEGSLKEYYRAERAGGLGPLEWLLYYNIGDDLMALGRLEAAIDAYRRATQLLPSTQFHLPYLALAVAYERDDQLGRARDALAIALQRNWEEQLRARTTVFVPPGEVHYYFYVVHWYRNNPVEARRELERFLATVPASPYAARARTRLAPK